MIQREKSKYRSVLLVIYGSYKYFNWRWRVLIHLLLAIYKDVTPVIEFGVVCSFVPQYFKSQWLNDL